MVQGELTFLLNDSSMEDLTRTQDQWVLIRMIEQFLFEACIINL